MNFWTLSLIAGICFTLWPLFMNKSGLNGFVSAACFGIATLTGVLPLALKTNGATIPNAHWSMVVAAGISGAMGLMCFTTLLSRVQSRDLGPYLVIVSLIQVAMNAAYQAYVSQGLPPQRIGGYIAAAIATYLLVR